MSLEVKINEAIIAGMKAQDKATLRALRGIKSAIMLVKTDGSGNIIDEAKRFPRDICQTESGGLSRDRKRRNSGHRKILASGAKQR